MERTIRVTGRAKLNVKADMIRFDIFISDIYKNYEKAIEKSAEKTKKLRNLFKSIGMDPNSLKTKDYSIDTKYEHFMIKMKIISQDLLDIYISIIFI